MLDPSFPIQDFQSVVYLILTLSHGAAVVALWRWHRLMLVCYLASTLAYGLALALHTRTHAVPPSPNVRAVQGIYALLIRGGPARERTGPSPIADRYRR